jgi:hypothetical protein
LVGPIAEICEAFARRREVVRGCSVDEFLAGVEFAPKLKAIRETGQQVERMHRSFNTAQALCLPVAVVFMLALAMAYGMFFAYHHWNALFVRGLTFLVTGEGALVLSGGFLVVLHHRATCYLSGLLSG